MNVEKNDSVRKEGLNKYGNTRRKVQLQQEFYFCVCILGQFGNRNLYEFFEEKTVEKCEKN